MTEFNYIGFYNLHDEPCRIFTDEYSGMPRAEQYVKGQGFVPALVSEVVHEGNPISKQSFKKMVLAVTQRLHAHD